VQFKIRGTPIKSPDNFRIELFNVTDMERLANAKMVGDLIAKKRKFYFTYDGISSYDWDAILDLIWEDSGLFFTLTYPYNGIEKTAVVYVGSIPMELHRGGKTTNWVWRNVNFNLIEQ
jgi:hypothetical protein